VEARQLPAVAAEAVVPEGEARAPGAAGAAAPEVRTPAAAEAAVLELQAEAVAAAKPATQAAAPPLAPTFSTA
jgi:hypothetical protein